MNKSSVVMVAFREARYKGEPTSEMVLCRTRTGLVQRFNRESTARDFAGSLGTVTVMTLKRADMLDKHPERAFNWVPKGDRNNGSKVKA